MVPEAYSGTIKTGLATRALRSALHFTAQLHTAHQPADEFALLVRRNIFQQQTAIEELLSVIVSQ